MLGHLEQILLLVIIHRKLCGRIRFPLVFAIGNRQCDGKAGSANNGNYASDHEDAPAPEGSTGGDAPIVVVRARDLEAGLAPPVGIGVVVAVVDEVGDVGYARYGSGIVSRDAAVVVGVAVLLRPVLFGIVVLLGGRTAFGARERGEAVATAHAGEGSPVEDRAVRDR